MDIDSVTARLLAQLTEWNERPCVIEFSHILTKVAGLCRVTEISETRVRFCLLATGGAICELSVPLVPPPLSFTLKSFTQASESTLQPAIAELTSELGRPFQTDVLELVAHVSFTSGAALLIGPLRQDITPLF